MRKTACFVVLLCYATLLFAQDHSSGISSEESTSISKVLDRGLSSVEEEFVGAAEAMPQEKYHFAPTNGEFKGVRDFATQVKHVAAVSNLVSSNMLAEKLPADSGRENGPDKINTKNDILKYLRDSFARAHRAIAAVNKENA